MVALFESDEPFVVVAAPRGHAKTTRLSIRWVLWRLLHRDPFILLISNTWEQSLNVIRAILYHCTYNEPLRDFYDIKIERENKDDMIISFNPAPTRDGFGARKRSRIVGRGTGQSMRGIIAEDEHRPSLIMFDDMEDDKRVENPRLRREDMSWFWSVLVPMRDRAGQIRGVGTIMNKNSLLQQFVKQWPSLKYSAIVGEEQALWPEHMSYKDLRLLLEQYTAMGQRHKFFCEYCNDPQDPEDIMFKSDWIHYNTPGATQLDQYMITTVVDPAFSQHKHSDSVGITTCAWSRTRPSTMWILDARKGQWTLFEIFEQIYSLHKQWRIAKVYIEGVQAQVLMKEVLTRELQRLRVESVARAEPFVPFHVELVTPGRKSKGERINALTVPFARGQIFWTDSFPELREEYDTYPHGSHDDLLDSLAYQLQINAVSSEPINPPPKKDEGGYLIDMVMNKVRRDARRINRHE